MNRPAILESVERLRLARQAAAQSNSAELQWLALGMEHYLQHAPNGLTMEAAFGLAGGQAQPRWWTLEDRLKRDEMIRSTAARHWAGVKPTPAAAAFDRAMQRHEAVYWRDGFERPAPPDGLQRELFEIRRLGPAPRRRQLQDILGG